MSNLIKLTLSFTPEAVAVLDAHASPRKRGELVSKLLVAYGAGAGGMDAVDVEGMKLQIMGLASANKSLEARVLRLERQMAGKQTGEQAQHRSSR